MANPNKYKSLSVKFGIFTNKKDANIFLDNSNFPLVIKADGLASGKGVYICENKKCAIDAINEITNLYKSKKISNNPRFHSIQWLKRFF